MICRICLFICLKKTSLQRGIVCISLVLIYKIHHIFDRLVVADWRIVFYSIMGSHFSSAIRGWRDILLYELLLYHFCIKGSVLQSYLFPLAQSPVEDRKMPLSGSSSSSNAHPPLPRTNICSRPLEQFDISVLSCYFL